MKISRWGTGYPDFETPQQRIEAVGQRHLRRGSFRLRCSYRGRSVACMKPIQAVCDTCNKTVEAKPLLSENELWLALNKGDEIEVMHLADDVHHTWKLTGQDKQNLLKARAAGTV
jgi:hypothetical protein